MEWAEFTGKALDGLLPFVRRMICPECHIEYSAEQGSQFFPFCSSRCKLLDLAKWSDEEFCIPVVDLESINEKDLEMEDLNEGA